MEGKEKARMRKAASRERLRKEKRKRLEILPPPQEQHHEAIKEFARKFEEIES
jgi:hypothetical protein